MKKKGLFNQLRSKVTSTAGKLVGTFKKKHKLSGTNPKVMRILEEGAWYRGTFLFQSTMCLLALVFLIAAMLLLKEDTAKVLALMGDTVVIAGTSAVVFMQFAANLLVWGTWKFLWLLCGYLWTFAAPVGAFILSCGEIVQPVWDFLSGFLF